MEGLTENRPADEQPRWLLRMEGEAGESPPGPCGVRVLRSPDVLIYPRTKQAAEGWIHGGSAAVTLANTMTLSVGFLNAVRRQLHPETR